MLSNLVYNLLPDFPKLPSLFFVLVQKTLKKVGASGILVGNKESC